MLPRSDSDETSGRYVAYVVELVFEFYAKETQPRDAELRVSRLTLTLLAQRAEAFGESVTERSLVTSMVSKLRENADVAMNAYGPRLPKRPWRA